jgi:hypothetical protein
LDLTADELVAKVDEFKQKGWRPMGVSAQVGSDPPRFLATFSENKPALEWDFSADLTSDEYEAALKKRGRTGYRPQAVTSAVVAGVVRYTVAWVEAQPGSAQARPAPDGVTDFRSKLGLTEDGLTKWADALPAGFRPVAISARVGAAEPLFDAIAVADGNTGEWKLQTIAAKKHETMFNEMFKADFRCDSAFLYKSAARVITEGTVWIKDGHKDSAESWIGDRRFINTKLKEFHDAGNCRPANVTAILGDEGHLLEVNGLPGSRLEWEARFDLTPEDLPGEVAAYRKKDWRLESLAVGDTGPGARYFGVFVKDEQRVDWDFQAGLTPASLEKAVEERKAKKFRPASIVSESDGKKVLYTVVWVGFSPKK